ncbi:MAG: cyclase family protein [Actinobacteria bacterium]|nr:cyclase family protein [Actinomycetota bacterium]
MVDLSRYRLVDLSEEIAPGERKIDGRYLHGEPHRGRPVELQEFIAFGARMHHVQTQTHLGTHAEAAYKYDEHGADLAQMPLGAYRGEAVNCDFSHKAARDPVGIADFQRLGVRTGDIVLAWASPATAHDPPFITNAAIDWMIAIRIKAFAFQDIRYSPPGTPLGQGDSDCRLLLAGIPVYDGVVGLHQLTKRRVFFIGLPAKMRRVTAFTTRAIALEPLDG